MSALNLVFIYLHHILTKGITVRGVHVLADTVE
jgi:hypothetical protein